MVAMLTEYPEKCAQLKGWPPTQFIKMVKLSALTFKHLVLIDTANRFTKIYEPSTMDTMSKQWQVYDGGENYGDFNALRF